MSTGTQTMDKRWYIVHAYSNFEKKVSESIREQAKQRGLEDLFEQVLVPTEKVTEVRRGRKIDAERKFFPGYVLVKMKLTDEAFEIGENVRVADGPFASFSGVVEEIDEARSRVKVAVSIFGRATPVELEFGQVEKV
jgi:transcriptional antiterminator NusG